MEEERKYYEDIAKMHDYVYQKRPDIQATARIDANGFVEFNVYDYFDFIKGVMKNDMPIRKKMLFLTVYSCSIYIDPDGTGHTYHKFGFVYEYYAEYRKTLKNFNKGYVDIPVYHNPTGKHEIWRISMYSTGNVYHQHAKQYNKHNKAYLHKRRSVRQ